MDADEIGRRIRANRAEYSDVEQQRSRIARELEALINAGLAAGLNQSEIARRGGISRHIVWHVARGERQP